jgi:hypothetical protein
MRDTKENRRLRALLWIVRLLERHGALTLKEINEYWCADESLSDGVPIERRTFYNYKNAILDLLKINIECDPRDGNRYKIMERDDDEMSQWLVKSFTVNEILASNADMRSRILLEEIPAGQEFLMEISEAMRTGCKIRFEYQRFMDYQIQHVVGAPYCVKLYHQRWYVLMKEWRTLLVTHALKEEMHVYSLDRILSMQVTDERFEMEADFDAKEYFKYAFGTRVEKDNPPQRVLLKVVDYQRDYFRTLPLHASQREIETQEKYSIFELNVALTIELTMQILYYGARVEVLEPQELREEVEEEAYQLMRVYGDPLGPPA